MGDVSHRRLRVSDRSFLVTVYLRRRVEVFRSSEYAVIIDAVDRFALDKGTVARCPIQMDYILTAERVSSMTGIKAHGQKNPDRGYQLARVYELCRSTGVPMLVPGILSGHSSLGERIVSLLRRGRRFSARPSLTTLSISALLFTALLGAGCFIPSWIAFAQTTSNLPTSFEVASIRPANGESHNRGLKVWGNGKFTATNWPVKTLIGFAYPNIKSDQIEGLPAWAKKQLYTINAVPPPSTPDVTGPERNQMVGQMVRSLLTDRFKLRVHDTVKQLPVYKLVIAKGGLKLKPIGRDNFIVNGKAYRPGASLVNLGRGRINARGVSVSALATGLSRILGRPVIDQTGLTGRYDFTLTWVPLESNPGGEAGGSGFGGDIRNEAGMPPAAASSGTSIFTAIQRQLGLKLKPAKAPVEILVVDRIEPPTPN